MTTLFFLLRPSRKVLRKVAMLADQCTTVMLNSTKSNDGGTEVTTHCQRTDVRRRETFVSGSEFNRTRKHAVLLFHNSTDEAVSTFSKYFANTHFYKFGKVLP